MDNLLIQAYLYALNHSTEFLQAVETHLILVGISLGIAIVTMVPLGVWTARSPRVSTAVMNVINAVRVLPSLAILFILVPYLGLDTRSAAVALTVLALPPILINTDAAFRNLDRNVLEAARGIGMTARQSLIRVEFPLALPVILTGVRTSSVEVIASATLAAFVGSGGLGIYITRGFALYDFSILMVGAIPVAVLTLFVEAFLAYAQNALKPPA